MYLTNPAFALLKASSMSYSVALLFACSRFSLIVPRIKTGS